MDIDSEIIVQKTPKHGKVNLRPPIAIGFSLSGFWIWRKKNPGLFHTI